MLSKSLFIKITVLLILFFFVDNVFLCKKSIKQPIQYFNVKKVRMENKVEPRLYLSFQCG